MVKDNWPHIDALRLRSLWDRHAPPFLHLDDVDSELPKIREQFLIWLEGKGLVDKPGVQVITSRKRIRLTQVSFSRSGLSTETEVSLALDDATSAVKRQGIGAGDDLIRLPAEATAEAIRQILPIVDFDIESAFTLAARNQRQPIAIVVAQSENHQLERYVGACTIWASAAEAAAKATLAAINRRAELAATLVSN
jgi:hypothetical protein